MRTLLASGKYNVLVCTSCACLLASCSRHPPLPGELPSAGTLVVLSARTGNEMPDFIALLDSTTPPMRLPELTFNGAQYVPSKTNLASSVNTDDLRLCLVPPGASLQVVAHYPVAGWRVHSVSSGLSMTHGTEFDHQKITILLSSPNAASIATLPALQAIEALPHSPVNWDRATVRKALELGVLRSLLLDDIACRTIPLCGTASVPENVWALTVLASIIQVYVHLCNLLEDTPSERAVVMHVIEALLRCASGVRFNFFPVKTALCSPD